ncbi:MAG TPA: phosphoglucosamine mutase [Pyrinomonadaceae bacterium]|nr:phosphoglucosamine mutase [Pyrinomonadaceae bacterium]
MKKLFGTDGIRGRAGEFPLDSATVRVMGRSLALHLARQKGSTPRIVLGRDTRESGAWIETALAAGANEAGAEVESAGVITTPGVAFLARTLPADAGVVISASHNPFDDNGIKVFAPSGRKISDSMERLIEADIAAETERILTTPPSENSLDLTLSEAHSSHADELRASYLEYLGDEIGAGLSLEGFRIVVDCANGAASNLAPKLFQRLGATVVAINNQPDGRNINRDCGSLHIEGLQKRVTEEGADLGVAYDGDADRALFVNARGEFVDGDATLWVLAQFMQERGMLKDDTVVATVMSNIGLEIALRSRGIQLLRTDVGDKYVLEELLKTSANLGGEQSGHIIFPEQSLAGDGMITTLSLLRAVRETGRKLHELTLGFKRYPQILVNVRVREKRPFEEVEQINDAARDVMEKLAGRGRLLLRYSGTEPLARVMIEGERQDEIDMYAGALAAIIKKEIGALDAQPI